MRFFLLFFIPLFCMAVPNPAGRPSKAPFISGDAFRAYSDYCFDEVDKTLNPSEVKEGSVVFVKTDYLDEYFLRIHPLIQNRYILICHNSDDPSPGPFAAFLEDEKLIAWFGQNYDGYPHPKMHPIPMGIANFCWPHGNPDILEEVQRLDLKKQFLAHMQFTVSTNSEERHPVFRQFIRASYCYYPPKKPFRSYMEDIARSKFEIAPRGHALDTHRIWESLYVGTIPVVRTSSLDCLYDGLPVLIIESWDQVTESFLKEMRHGLKKKTFQMEKLSMDYWTKLIDSYRSG